MFFKWILLHIGKRDGIKTCCQKSLHLYLPISKEFFFYYYYSYVRDLYYDTKTSRLPSLFAEKKSQMSRQPYKNPGIFLFSLLKYIRISAILLVELYYDKKKKKDFVCKSLCRVRFPPLCPSSPSPF